MFHFFQGRVSLYSTGYPGTYYVVLVGLKPVILLCYLPSAEIYINSVQVCKCVCVGGHAYHVHVEVREQLA